MPLNTNAGFLSEDQLGKLRRSRYRAKAVGVLVAVLALASSWSFVINAAEVGRETTTKLMRGNMSGGGGLMIKAHDTSRETRGGTIILATVTVTTEDGYTTGLCRLQEQSSARLEGSWVTVDPGSVTHENPSGTTDSAGGRADWKIPFRGPDITPGSLSRFMTSGQDPHKVHARAILHKEKREVELRDQLTGPVSRKYRFACTGTCPNGYSDFAFICKTQGKFVGKFSGGANIEATGSIDTTIVDLCGGSHVVKIELAPKTSGVGQVVVEEEKAANASATAGLKVGTKAKAGVPFLGEGEVAAEVSGSVTLGGSLGHRATVTANNTDDQIWNIDKGTVYSKRAFRLGIGQQIFLSEALDYSCNVTYKASLGAQDALPVAGYWGTDEFFTHMTDIIIVPWCGESPGGFTTVDPALLEYYEDWAEKNPPSGPAPEEPTPAGEGGSESDGGDGGSNPSNNEPEGASVTDGENYFTGEVGVLGGDDLDWWKIEVPAFTRAQVVLAMSDTPVAAAVYEQDPLTLQPTASAIAEGAQTAEKTLWLVWDNDTSSTRQYLVRFEASSEVLDGVASYTFGLSRGVYEDPDGDNDTWQTATEVSPASTRFLGVLPGGDLVDWLAIEVPAGGKFVVVPALQHGEARVELYRKSDLALDPYANFIEEIDLGAEEYDDESLQGPSFSLDESTGGGDTYFIRVSKEEGSGVVTYDVAVGRFTTTETTSENDAFDQAQVLAPNVGLDGSFDSSDEEDWYSFVAAPGTDCRFRCVPAISRSNVEEDGEASVTVEVYAAPTGEDPPSNPLWLVSDSTWVEIDGVQNSGSEPIELLIRVLRGTESILGVEYSMLFTAVALQDIDSEASDAPSESYLLSADSEQDVMGSLWLGDAEDWYQLTLDHLESALIEVTAESADVAVEIYDEDGVSGSTLGTPLASSSAEGSGLEELTFGNVSGTEGTFFIRIRRVTSAVGTAYRMALGRS